MPRAAAAPRSTAFMLTPKNRGAAPDGMREWIARAAEGLDAGGTVASRVGARAPLGNTALKALQSQLRSERAPTLPERAQAGVAAGAAGAGGGDLAAPWITGPWVASKKFAVPMRARACVLRTVFGARVALPVARFPPTAAQRARDAAAAAARK